MLQLTRTGVGTADTPNIIHDNGSGRCTLQAAVTGTATFRVLGRVSRDAPWLTVKESGTADFISAIDFTPFLRLEITSGAGSVNLFIAADAAPEMLNVPA